MYLALRLMSLTLIVAIKIAGAIQTNGRGRDKEDDPHQVIVDVVVTDSNNQPVVTRISVSEGFCGACRGGLRRRPSLVQSGGACGGVFLRP